MSEELSTAQARALAAVLDAIIPPGGGLPGAGELGLGAGLAAQASLRPTLVAGLAALDELARERGVTDFAELAAARRADLLNALGAKLPAFLPTLVAQTFASYYRSPPVLEGLGLEARPPYPQGYTVEPTDFSILDPVRTRAPFYRKPG